MKYYDEASMKEVREALEASVMQWSGVTNRGIMGCLVYFRGRKFLAFLVTNGLVITKLTKEDREELAGQVPARDPEDLRTVLPYVRKSYEAIVD